MTETRICSKCKIEKPLSEFYMRAKPDSQCKDCRRQEAMNRYHEGGKDQVRKWRKENPELYHQQHRRAAAKRKSKINSDPAYREKLLSEKRENSRKNFITGMLGRAVGRARKYGVEFTITRDDIIVPELCPILGIPLILGTKGNYRNSPSIDRVEASGGYIPGNVRVISTLANTMKNGATREELIAFSKNILDYIDHKI